LKYPHIILAISLFLVLVMVAGAGCDQPSAPGPFQRGKPAPDFTFTDIDGKTFTLSASRGSVVMLNFWIPGKDENRAQLPEIAAALSRLRGQGLVVISISPAGSEVSVRQTIGGKAYDWTFAADNALEMTRVYGIIGMETFPISIFITPSGNYDSQHIGVITRGTIEQAFGFAQRGR
jgi:peroxiredoxin